VLFVPLPGGLQIPECDLSRFSVSLTDLFVCKQIVPSVGIERSLFGLDDRGKTVDEPDRPMSVRAAGRVSGVFAG
jgi:hypothetical protein